MKFSVSLPGAEGNHHETFAWNTVADVDGYQFHVEMDDYDNDHYDVFSYSPEEALAVYHVLQAGLLKAGLL